MDYAQQQAALKAAIAAVPTRFCLRSYYGPEFRVVGNQSYYSEIYGIQLYTFRVEKTVDGVNLLAFCKGTPEELADVILPPKDATPEEISAVDAYIQAVKNPPWEDDNT